MKYRKLRIAWSVTCGILCLLLIALWVRSYWRYTDAGTGVGKLAYVGCNTYQGTLQINWGDPELFGGEWFWSDTSHAEFNALISGSPDAPPIIPPRLFPGFSYGHGYLSIPLWFLVFIATGITVAPWLSWSRRFSLRTLLIGMTAAAAILGVAVYALN
jgi:hypothetical protein